LLTIVRVYILYYLLTTFDAMRCDAMSYFDVRSKADKSQLILPHGTENLKVKGTKIKKIKTDMLISHGNSPGKFMETVPRSPRTVKRSSLRNLSATSSLGLLFSRL